MVALAFDIVDLILLVVILVYLIRTRKPVYTQSEPILPSGKIVSTPNGIFTIPERREPIAVTEEELWEREQGYRD